MKIVELQNIQSKEILKAALRSAPQNGYTLGEVRQGLKAISLLDGDDIVLSFEDADFEFVRGCLGKATWMVLDERIVEICEAFGL